MKIGTARRTDGSACFCFECARPKFCMATAEERAEWAVACAIFEPIHDIPEEQIEKRWE